MMSSPRCWPAEIARMRSARARSTPGRGVCPERMTTPRIDQGSLFATLSNGEYRYPAWQFTDDPRSPVLPGLAQLVPAIPADWHPVTIPGFMTTPQRDARIDGAPVTLQEQLLRGGGDPLLLRNILNSFLMT